MTSHSLIPHQAGFAHYILAADRVCDSLLCAEAWDFLRDVLLLVFARHFVEDDEPLALVICPIICRALIQLIQMDTQAGKSPTSNSFSKKSGNSSLSAIHAFVALDYESLYEPARPP
jgi:hypothetical protein